MTGGHGWVNPRPHGMTARCGGPAICGECALEAASAHPGPAVPGSGPTAADPDKHCLHENFDASVGVNRLTAEPDGPVTAYSADVRIWCTQCGEPFRWTGIPAGLMPGRPMVSVDEAELHAPVRPASSDPDFGMGIPWFAIRMNGEART